MPEDLQKKIAEATGVGLGDLVRLLVLVAVAIVLAYVLWALLKRRKRVLPPQVPDLAVDVMSLPTAGPPASGPALYYYNVPVRLAAVVLAPAGRVRDLPPPGQLDDVLDSIVPGLAQVVSTHAPLVRYWPRQLSAKGFAHAFFGHARLPGQGGKGTPWCSAAGIFKIEGQPLMAGLVMRAQTTSNLGQAIVEREAQWLDLLRIK